MRNAPQMGPMKKKTNQPRNKIKARPLCDRLRGVARAAAERAVQEGQDPELAKHAEMIRTLGKRVVKDIIEIGRRLTEAKKLVGHGHWADWLKTEFDWSEGTALNFMRVFEFAEDYKSKNFMDLKIADLSIAPSALYALARPGTPEEVRAEMMERAEAGEAISNSDVQEALATHAETNKAEQPAQEKSEEQPAQEKSEEQPAQEESEAEQPAQEESEAEQPAQEESEEQAEEQISPETWNGRRLLVANKAAGDARIEDWTKFALKEGVLEAVKHTADAWRRLVEHLEQPSANKAA
jgi:hypothetical protein